MSRVERQAGTSTYAYDFFISYSRTPDADLVQALQRRLERFTSPWWRRRRWRVFHDESSMSASHDLKASLERALSRSGWLIVVLSPQTAKSGYVADEIAWWLAHPKATGPDPLET